MGKKKEIKLGEGEVVISVSQRTIEIDGELKIEYTYSDGTIDIIGL